MNTVSSTIYGWASLFVGGVASFYVAKKYLDSRRKLFLEEEEGKYIPDNLETFEDRLAYYESKGVKADEPRNKKT